MLKKIFVSVIAVLLALSTHQAPAEPANSSETTRIVSLVPNLTELAFTLQAGPQVVGVSDFCIYPPEAKTRPSVGGLINPSLEGVLALRPTVVLLYRSQIDFAARLKTLGIKSESFQVDHLSDLYSAIDRMGTVTGHTTRSKELSSSIRQRLADIKTSATGQPSLRGIVIVSRDPSGLKALYQGTFLSELYTITGGSMAIPHGTALSREAIIKANPDIIIDFSSSNTSAPGTIPITRAPGPWAELTTVKAVKTNHVYQVSDPHASLLGPSIIQTAETFRKLLDQAKD